MLRPSISALFLFIEAFILESFLFSQNSSLQPNYELYIMLTFACFSVLIFHFFIEKTSAPLLFESKTNKFLIISIIITLFFIIINKNNEKLIIAQNNQENIYSFSELEIIVAFFSIISILISAVYIIQTTKRSP